MKRTLVVILVFLLVILAVLAYKLAETRKFGGVFRVTISTVTNTPTFTGMLALTSTFAPTTTATVPATPTNTLLPPTITATPNYSISELFATFGSPVSGGNSIPSCNLVSATHDVPGIYFGAKIYFDSIDNPLEADVDFVAVETNSRGQPYWEPSGMKNLFAGRLYAQPQSTASDYTHTAQTLPFHVDQKVTFYQLRILNSDGTMSDISVGGAHTVCTIVVNGRQQNENPDPASTEPAPTDPPPSTPADEG